MLDTRPLGRFLLDNAAMTDFFTSDIHFGHTNILDYTDRPWATTEEMDEAIIAEWNATVKPQDRVFVVGDFSFRGGEATDIILSRLRGQKFLVIGNHDHSEILEHTKRWAWTRIRHTHRIGPDAIVLDHFPKLSWLGMHYGYYHLHGHCHGDLRLPESLERARILDVGIDATVKWTGSYRPVAWEEVKERLRDKGPSSTDGHRVRNHGN